MKKRALVALAALVLLGRCAPAPVSGGGGASETVATVTEWENGIRVHMASDGPFTVTAEACSDSFSTVDTQYFHTRTLIDNSNPDWYIAMVPDEPLTIIIKDANTGTATLLTYKRQMKPKGDPVPLAATGAVSGTVSDSSGNEVVPLSGIQVYIKGSFFTATTDSAGYYRIAGLPAGRYSIAADAQVMVYINERITTIDISGDTTVTRNFTLLLN